MEAISVLICGSRKWTDRAAIQKVIDKLPKGSRVIAGGAEGADKIAEELALERDDLTVEIIYARWNLYGKSAGPMRNLEMLDKKPDIVYAFPLGKSIGTYHTMREARARKIPVIVGGLDVPIRD